MTKKDGVYKPQPKLKAALARAAVNMRELADAWGVAPPTARGRLNGNCPITLNQIGVALKLCTAKGVAPAKTGPKPKPKAKTAPAAPPAVEVPEPAPPPRVTETVVETVVAGQQDEQDHEAQVHTENGAHEEGVKPILTRTERGDAHQAEAKRAGAAYS